MALRDMIMPKMGESVMEGTIIKWFKTIGDQVKEDESILEVATDKVDTEIPSTFSGTIKEILIKEGEIAQVGAVIARIETDKEAEIAPSKTATKPSDSDIPVMPRISGVNIESTSQHQILLADKAYSNRFYSPLVLNIAKQEQIPLHELERIPGTGKDERLTKNDILAYIAQRNKPVVENRNEEKIAIAKPETAEQTTSQTPEKTTLTQTFSEAIPNKEIKHPVSTTSFSGAHDIIEMTRMRKMIAERMLESKRISPHVTSFVEADVTNIAYWRNRNKKYFQEKENTILTYTPIFIEAVVKAIKDYPMINVSVEGDKIIVKKEINIGLAVALQDGNLIVPVIKNADQLNIVGLTKKVNELAKKARNNKLSPDDLTGGTYTISNMGSFGNLMGTPIIVQPQVGILALGAVVKKPAVIETAYGDTIGIRHMMFLSHSYDHRVVDGALGGMFVRRVADYLEKFDLERKVQ